MPRDADEERLRRAWRERAKRYHPDVNPSPLAAEVFQHMRLAYEVLCDPRARARLDERLRRNAPTPPHRYTGHQPHLRQRPLQGSPIPRWAFIGLHLTGLVFGVVLILGTIWNVQVNDWPALMLLACVPGIAVLPDSVMGLLHTPENDQAGHRVRPDRVC